MTLLVAVGLLFSAALGEWLWWLWRPQQRGRWLGALMAVTLAYGLALVAPSWGARPSLSAQGLFWPQAPPPAAPLSGEAWPWTLLVLGMGTAVIWAGVRYAQRHPASPAWGSLLLAIGWLALGSLAAHPATLVLAWVPWDGLALGMALRQPGGASRRAQAVALAWARSLGWMAGLGSLWAPPRTAGVILTLAVLWRLLWQPWEVVEGRPDSPSYGLGKILRWGQVLLTLEGLRFVPSGAGPWGEGVLLGIAVVAVGVWVVRREGRADVLSVAVGGLAALAAGQGAGAAVVAAAALYVTLSVPAALGRAAGRAAWWAWGGVWLALLQVPWTPGAPWAALWSALGWGARGGVALVWLGLAWGAVRRARLAWEARQPPASPGEAQEESAAADQPFAPWAPPLYPLGLMMPLIGAYRWSVTLPLGPWSPGWAVAGLLGGALGVGGWWILRRWPWLRWGSRAWGEGERLTLGLGRTLWAFYRWSSRMALFLAGLLEGEGGVLWAVVLLGMLLLWMTGG